MFEKYLALAPNGESAAQVRYELADRRQNGVSGSPTVFQQTLLGFLQPVARFLTDDSVSEVMINGFEEVFIERAGRLHRTDAKFPSDHALASAVRNIAQYVGKSVDPERPILDARLPDGSRVCAILPPASRRGISRLHPPLPQGAAHRRAAAQVRRASPRPAAKFLDLCVQVKRNVMVAGGTGSGKTSLLNALSSFIPHAERIVVIEDSSRSAAAAAARRLSRGAPARRQGQGRGVDPRSVCARRCACGPIASSSASAAAARRSI